MGFPHGVNTMGWVCIIVVEGGILRVTGGLVMGYFFETLAYLVVALLMWAWFMIKVLLVVGICLIVVGLLS